MVGWVFFGLFVGLAAKLLLTGPDPGGVIITVLVGIAGGFLGGFIGQSLGWYHEGDSRGLPFDHETLGRLICT